MLTLPGTSPAWRLAFLPPRDAPADPAAPVEELALSRRNRASVEVWSLATGRIVERLKLPKGAKAITDLAARPMVPGHVGERLASDIDLLAVTASGQLFGWNRKRQRVIEHVHLGSGVGLSGGRVALSPCGGWAYGFGAVVSRMAARNAHVWSSLQSIELPLGRPGQRISRPGSGGEHMALGGPPGRLRLAVNASFTEVLVIDGDELQTRERGKEAAIHQVVDDRRLMDVAVCPQGSFVATLGEEMIAVTPLSRSLASPTGQELVDGIAEPWGLECPDWNGGHLRVAAHPEDYGFGSALLFGSPDGELRMYDAETGDELGAFDFGHAGTMALATAPAARLNATADAKGVVTVWEV